MHNLVSIALSFVIAVIVISVGAQILGEIQSTQTQNTSEWNVTGKGLTGMGTLGSWLPTIATIIAAATVITIVIMAFRPTMFGAPA